ncbi:MAG: hypothetical protein GXP33_06885 [Spirochaetes bacterium]|nr:hypothetical protein [Spirochaetota bacterium]
MTVLTLPELLLLLTAFIVGIKHGVDWDHIAAIMDITSTQTSKRRGIFLGFLYSAGHASVVAALALGVLLIGISLPKSMDILMDKVVGITLVILGGYVFYALYKHKGKDFRILPRWALLANAVLRVYDRIAAKISGAPGKRHQVLKNGYGNTAAYVIGTIHGIGANTPTQVFLFTLALGAGAESRRTDAAGGREFGIFVILAFVIGLIVTNTIMAVMGSYGFVGSSNKHKLYRIIALITGLFSLSVGLVFVIGGAGYLPDIQTLFPG